MSQVLTAKSPDRNGSDIVFEADQISVGYATGRGMIQAVRDVSLQVRRGQMVGLAGESGSGKSTLVLAATRILKPPAIEVTGSVRLAGHDMFALSERELRRIRWNTFSFVTQSAMNALNPVMRLFEQMFDAMRAHDRRVNRAQARRRAEEVFRMVELPAVKLDSFPHQLSGGMRQRAVIAMALLLQPELIIMDEPTTALDVVAQREIIMLIRGLQQKLGFAVLLITHDLSLLLEIADEVVVLYGGRIMERGASKDLLVDARHPYSKALMNSFPPLHGPVEHREGIPGSPPDMLNPPAGCPFAPRCPEAVDACVSDAPPLRQWTARDIACHVAVQAPYVVEMKDK